MGHRGLAYTRSPSQRADHVSLPHSSRSNGIHPPEQGFGLVSAPARELIDAVLQAALDEDGIAEAWVMTSRGVGAAQGAVTTATRRRIDLTSDACIPEHALARARLVAKAPGVLSGVGIFSRALEICDPKAQTEILVRDGERVSPGQEVLRTLGKARGLLYAERTGLNFVQRLSGVATLTARYVELCAGRLQSKNVVLKIQNKQMCIDIQLLQYLF